MSSQANIVVFDGAATPVSHTLVPLGSKNDEKIGLLAYWREALSAVPIFANVRLTTFFKKLKGSMERCEIRVEVPVMESVSGQNAAGYTASPRVAYVNQVSVVAYFHERATIAERRLVKQVVANLLNNVSTSVAAASAGPAAELIDQGITGS